MYDSDVRVVPPAFLSVVTIVPTAALFVAGTSFEPVTPVASTVAVFVSPVLRIEVESDATITLSSVAAVVTVIVKLTAAAPSSEPLAPTVAGVTRTT